MNDESAPVSSSESDNAMMTAPDDTPMAEVVERKYKLAYFPTTPSYVKILLPLIILITHGAFLYGQIQVMWYLFFEVHFEGSVKATAFDSQMLFKVLGLHNPQDINSTQMQRLDEFTYGEAISKLWQGENLDSLFGARLGAFFLVLFSGFWPHLKLFMMQFYFFADINEHRRTRGLYWMSSLGKYSIADVFVVCILISVCNLHLNLHPKLILKQAKKLAPKIVKIIRGSVSEHDAVNEVCNDLLQLHCQVYDQFTLNALPNATISCSLCTQTVKHFFEYPALLSSVVEEILNGLDITGNGYAKLRIAGLSGLHVFCVAVLSSMILGLSIDIVAHKAKAFCAKTVTKTRSKSASSMKRMLDNNLNEAMEPLLQHEDRDRYGSVDEDINFEVEHVLFDKDRMFLPYFKRMEANSMSFRTYMFLVMISLGLFVLALVAFNLESMERNVPGSIPSVINETLFFDFQESYSLWSLVDIIGQRGGWDYFLKLLFAFFCLVGPLIRIGAIIVQLVIPMTKRQHTIVLEVINNLGVFCALDVLMVAVGLVLMEMGPITNTIIQQDSKFCKTLRLSGYPDSCLTINFRIKASMAAIIFLYAALTCLSTIMIRNGFKNLNPYENKDTGGPYC